MLHSDGDSDEAISHVADDVAGNQDQLTGGQLSPPRLLWYSQHCTRTTKPLHNDKYKDDSDCGNNVCLGNLRMENVENKEGG